MRIATAVVIATLLGTAESAAQTPPQAPPRGPALSNPTLQAIWTEGMDRSRAAALAQVLLDSLTSTEAPLLLSPVKGG